MTALCDWGEIEIALGIARRWPGGEWDVSLWDEAEWEESDTPLGDWLDVTCDCLDGLSLAAGSSKNEGVVTRWEAATANLKFAGARYDPRTGPWQGLVGPGLPVRVRWRPLPAGMAAVDTLSLPRDAADWAVAFSGTVDNGGYKWDPATLVAEMNCSDRTSDLVAVDAEPTDPLVGANEWASARIHRLADVAYWPLVERDVTSGGVDLIPTKLEGSVWAQMLNVADSDIALLWVRRDGRLAFRPEGRIAENVPVGARLIACPENEPSPTPVPTNLLPTAEMASFEGGTTAGWTVAGGALTVTTDAADDGTHAAAITATGAGPYMQGGGFAQRIPVTPGQVVTVMASLRPSVAGRTAHLGVVWWDSAGAPTFVWSAVTALGPQNTWTRLALQFTAPATLPPAVRPLTSRITNDFEAGLNAYTTASANLLLDLVTDVVHGGAQAARVTRVNTGGAMVLYSNTQSASAKDAVTPGERVEFAAWVRHDESGDRQLRLSARFNLGNAGLQTIDGTTQAVPPGVWTRLTLSAVAPADIDSTTFLVSSTGTGFVVGTHMWVDDVTGTARADAPLPVVGMSPVVSPRGMVTGGGERTLVDRVGIFAGTWATGQWAPPGYVPADDDDTIGYVNLLHADPEVLRNWVTIAGKKLEGPNEPDRPVAVRIDSASVSRFRPQTYRAVDLLHADDAWSGTVADLVLADGAWPSNAPRIVELDTRTHDQAPQIAAVLLGLEPEHVFTVVAALDRSVEWRMIAAGWDVAVTRAYVAGSVDVEDVTGWGTAAGWDDPAPPHGWDVDTWALVGQGGGGGVGPGPGPSVITYNLDAETDVMPPGSVTQIPLFDPGTGWATRVITLAPGSYSLNALVTFAVPTAMGAAPNDVRAAIAVNGNEMATASGLTSMTEPTPVGVAIADLTVTSTALVELNAVSQTIPGRVVATTYLTVTRTA